MLPVEFNKRTWCSELHANILRFGLVDSLSVVHSIYHNHGCQMCIAGSQGGYGEEAFEYLWWMRRERPKPNEYATSFYRRNCLWKHSNA